MEKQRWEESRRRRKRSEKEKKDDAGARKGRKVAVHCVLAKSSPDERWKVARRCGAKHISKSKCAKHTNVGPLLEVELSKKVRAVVARSTFPSQNVQNTPYSDHFWKLRCRKSARRCGAKHIWKLKVSKTSGVEPFLTDVEKGHTD